MESDLVIRSMLTAFHIGPGGLDIMKALSLLGVGRVANFEKAFPRNAPLAHYIMNETAREMIEKACLNELVVTVE